MSEQSAIFNEEMVGRQERATAGAVEIKPSTPVCEGDWKQYCPSHLMSDFTLNPNRDSFSAPNG